SSYARPLGRQSWPARRCAMPHHDTSVRPFTARAADADLDDLRNRLAAARFPEVETVYRAAPDRRRWDQGVPLADLVDVVDYWHSGYDWRRSEERRVGKECRYGYSP